MKTRSYLFENMRSAIDNRRGHTIVTDLPNAKKGDDTGATALELTLMSFSGCITTIYALVAKNKKVPINQLLCEIEADEADDKGLDNIKANLKVIAPEASKEDLEKVFHNTLAACPVAKLYKSAGCNITETIEIVDEF